MEKEKEKKSRKKIGVIILMVILIIILLLCLVQCQSCSGDADPTGNTTATGEPTTEGTGNSEPSTEATTSGEDLTEPSGEATDPSTAPSEPSTEITEPSTDATEPSGHTHTYTETKTAPGCETEGYTTYTCACGDTFTGDKVVATGHQWGKWVATQEPTENTTGTAERVCADCAKAETKTLDKVIPQHTHKYSSKVTKAATCTSEGTKTYICPCGSSYTEKIDKVAHKYVDTVTKPTCTKEGYTTHKCSVCGNSYTDSKVSATGHSYTSKVTTEATCEKDGVKTYTCSKCSHSYTEAVKGKHSWKHVAEIPADCEEAIDCECGISATYAWAEAYGCDTLEETLYEMHKEWYGDGDLANEHNHERVVIRVVYVCRCGWEWTEYEAEQSGYGDGYYLQCHVNPLVGAAENKTEEREKHSYHTEREYVDADGYDVCTECGAKK